MSCKTLQQEPITDALKKINIPAPPYAIDESGNPYFYYDVKLNKYIVDPQYMLNIAEYQFKVEAAAAALEELK